MGNITFKSLIMNNLPWIVASIIGIGTIIGTISLHGILISDLRGGLKEFRISMDTRETRVDSIEKNLVRIEAHQEIIKDDIKDIKEIIINPKDKYNNNNARKIVCSSNSQQQGDNSL